MNQLAHIPILYNEIEELILKIKPHTVVDCTFGAGGHTHLFLKHLCKVIAFDFDINVANHVTTISHNNNFRFIHDSFHNIHHYNLHPQFIFADIGVSSMQLDEQNGFSFQKNTPLDMCSNSSSCSLSDKLQDFKYQDIYNILKEYTNLKNANIIASNIYNYKILHSIKTTFDLVKATKLNSDNYLHKPILAQIFQAFRVYNNNEITNLTSLCQFIVKLKCSFGIIAFNSLESSCIKNITDMHYRNRYFIKPSENEITCNTRARCAILRIGIE